MGSLCMKTLVYVKTVKVSVFISSVSQEVEANRDKYFQALNLISSFSTLN